MLTLKLVCIVRTVKANYKLEIVFTLLGGYCTIQPKISYFLCKCLLRIEVLQ